ncbi:hypothetical protein DFH11DRAFT_1545727 [Phellopilus nigrolimitatus]|nr:hypothetical protein DFH11DRAFT_1545727 [Phellopilus nigrolimitatus]
MDSDLAAELFVSLKIALSTAFIGYSVATTLYGITCLQLYLYYRNHAKDQLYVKIIVGVLWVLDTLTTVLVGHTLYTYLVLKLGEANIVFTIPCCKLNVWIQSLLLLKVSSPGKFGWIVLAFFAIVVVVHLFRDQSGLSLANPTVWVSGSVVQGIDALNDIIITVSFIYYLKAHRSTFRTVTQIVFVSLDVAFPGIVYWLPFQQAVGKLYVNSVLAALNARKSLASSTTNVIFSGGSSPGDPSSRTTEYDKRATEMVHSMSFAENCASKITTKSFVTESSTQSIV